MGISLVVVMLFAGCGEKKTSELSDYEALTFRIDSLESMLLNDSLEVSDATASAVIKAYLKFADTWPTDSSSVDYLFKAADVMRGMYRIQDAVQTLDLVVKRYPESEKAPSALFYAGFILHTDADQNNMAIEYFERLIEEFPNHPLSDDARNLMPLLYMSEEQLMDFLSRNQES
ncbi:MAG: tetratricopeptide repeat protein [Bacteroidia bacterium]